MSNPGIFGKLGAPPGHDAVAAPHGQLAAGGTGGGAPGSNVGVGEGSVLPGFGVAAKRRAPVNMHTVLVGVVVVIAGCAIYGMRRIGLGNLRATGAIVQTVDLADVPRADNRHIAVIAALNRSRSENQVELGMVKMNPFMLGSSEQEDEKPDSPSQDEAEKDRLAGEVAARKQQLGARAQKFTLNSVVAGGRPVARINGRLVRVGDKIDEVFRVAAITGRGVQIQADGHVFILELSTGQNPGQK